jgi:hypothetical protein
LSSTASGDTLASVARSTNIAYSRDVDEVFGTHRSFLSEPRCRRAITGSCRWAAPTRAAPWLPVGHSLVQRCCRSKLQPGAVRGGAVAWAGEPACFAMRIGQESVELLIAGLLAAPLTTDQEDARLPVCFPW